MGTGLQTYRKQQKMQICNFSAVLQQKTTPARFRIPTGVASSMYLFDLDYFIGLREHSLRFKTASRVRSKTADTPLIHFSNRVTQVIYVVHDMAGEKDSNAPVARLFQYILDLLHHFLI